MYKKKEKNVLVPLPLNQFQVYIDAPYFSFLKFVNNIEKSKDF